MMFEQCALLLNALTGRVTMSVLYARTTLAVLLVALALAVALGSAAEAGPSASGGNAGCATMVIAQAQSAATVAKRNPSAFRRAAARNQRSEAAFKNTAKDESLWLDACGQAFYVEEKVAASVAA